MNKTRRLRTVWISVLIIMPCLAAWHASVHAVHGASPLDQMSLGIVPANAAFYGALLRNRQQYDRLIHSRAAKRLHEEPFIQGIAGQLRMTYRQSDDFAKLRVWLAQPENERLLDLIRDAVSEEIFAYGDASWTHWLPAMSDASNAVNRAQLAAATRGEQPQEKEIVNGVLDALQPAIDKGPLPQMVWGFRISNPERASEQLDRLNAQLHELLNVQQVFALLRDRLRRNKSNDDNSLSITVDGTLLPWDQLREEFESKLPVETAERLSNVLKKTALTLEIAVRDNYVLISLRDGRQPLEIGQPGEKLASLPELQPVRDHQHQPLTSVSFSSGPFMNVAGSAAQQVQQLKQMAEAALTSSPDIAESLRGKLLGDLNELAQDVAQAMPSVGAHVRFTYLSDRGYEGYQFVQQTNSPWDSSRELSILRHVGGSPIFFFAGRAKYQPQQYELLVKWLQRAFERAREAGEAQLQGDNLAEFKQTFDQLQLKVVPVFARLNQTFRQKLVPALADGQSALVIDAQATSNQWHAAMPPAEQPLPMLELGIVLGVSEPDTVVEAGKEVFQQVRDLAGTFNELSKEGNKIPLEMIREPETLATPYGRRFYYQTPTELGLDAERFSLNVGLSKHFLAATYLPEYTDRLLTEQPLPTDAGLLAEATRPLAAVSHLEWRQFLEAVTPWIEYGVKQASQKQETQGIAVNEFVNAYLRLTIKLLGCFRGYTGLTRLENGTVVTHFQWRFQDLE